MTRDSDPPQIAYAQWLHACKQAGGHGTPVAEPVPVQDGLRRVVRAGGHRRSEPGEDIEAGELLLAAGHWLRPADLAAIADGTLLAAPHRHGAGTISRLIRASAWWPIPIGQGHFAAGEHIGVYPLPGAPA